jgi:hypothetical protein
VADTLHGVVQCFRSGGEFVAEVPTRRHADEASRPVAVVPLAGGGMLVVDHGDEPGLRRIGADGRVSDPGVRELADPVALCVDERQRVYVLDRHGTRVQRLGPDLGFDRVVVDLAEIGLGE